MAAGTILVIDDDIIQREQLVTIQSAAGAIPRLLQTIPVLGRRQLACIEAIFGASRRGQCTRLPNMSANRCRTTARQIL